MAESKKKTVAPEAAKAPEASPEAKAHSKRGRKPKSEKAAVVAAPEAPKAPEVIEAPKAPEVAPEAPKKAGKEFIVTADSGLRLRMTPPRNRQAISGVGGGFIITVMKKGSTFRELRRESKWSFGVYEVEGKELSGWTCNQYLRK